MSGRLFLDPAYDGLYYAGPPSDPFDVDALATGFYPNPTSNISSISFSWAGVDFTVDGPYYLTKVDGWSGPPDGSAQDVPVASGHGSMLTPVIRKSRIVTIEGQCVSRSIRDQLLQFLDDSFAAAFASGSVTSPLAGWVAGRVLTADAQLIRYAPLTENTNWNRGVFPFAIQWRCADPLRYGPQQVFSAAVAAPAVGLLYPVLYPVTYPANPPSGSIVINNPGNTATPALYTLRGPLTGRPGFVNATNNARVTFDFDIADGDVVTIDTAQSAAFLNGEYRPTRADSSLISEMKVPARVSTVQVLGAAGGTGSPGGSVAFKPAFW